MGTLDSALREAARTGPPFALVNMRNGTQVASRVEAAFDRASRRRGLLGRDGLAPGDALLLAPCPAVHTCFMRFAVDALFLDRDGVVVKVVRGLRPWRAAAARAYAVLEVPEGTAAATRTEVGDRLAIQGS